MSEQALSTWPQAGLSRVVCPCWGGLHRESEKHGWGAWASTLRALFGAFNFCEKPIFTFKITRQTFVVFFFIMCLFCCKSFGSGCSWGNLDFGGSRFRFNSEALESLLGPHRPAAHSVQSWAHCSLPCQVSQPLSKLVPHWNALHCSSLPIRLPLGGRCHTGPPICSLSGSGSLSTLPAYPRGHLDSWGRLMSNLYSQVVSLSERTDPAVSRGEGCAGSWGRPVGSHQRKL